LYVLVIDLTRLACHAADGERLSSCNAACIGATPRRHCAIMENSCTSLLYHALMRHYSILTPFDATVKPVENEGEMTISDAEGKSPTPSSAAMIDMQHMLSHAHFRTDDGLLC
jgi:hypothetical protein